MTIWQQTARQDPRKQPTVIHENDWNPYTSTSSLSYLIEMDVGQLWRRHINQIRLSGSNLSFDSTTNVDTDYHSSNRLPHIILSELLKFQLLTAVIIHNKSNNLQTGTFDIYNCCVCLNYFILLKGREMWYINVLCYIDDINYYFMGQ